MAQRVAGDLYYDLDGQLAEIKRQLRQSNGYPYNPDELKRHLQTAIEGRFPKMDVKPEIIFVHFNQSISTKSALVELEKKGLRSAEFAELLDYPTERQKFPIVVLDCSVGRSYDGGRSFPCLIWDGSVRCLDMESDIDGWDEGCLFAAVRK